jgi:hypothetical protein
MELKTAGIKTVRHSISTPKTQLMLSRQTINRLIIIGFMVLVGFCLAKAIYHQSVMGIILALTSLGAGIYFLYILAKAREEMEAEEAV